jgi:trimeric autotransporter adhesin
MSYITASTSVVLVATSSATTPSIVYFPNINSSGRLITVRDNDGAATATNPIILSTVGTANFVGIKNPILIAQSYGFVTLTSLPNGSYEVLNTFAFPPGQAVAYISNVTASTFTVQQGLQFRDLLNQDPNFLYTSSSQLLLNSTILGTVTTMNLQSSVIGLGSAGYISSYITPPQTSRIIAVGQSSNTVVGQQNPLGTRIFSDNNQSWQNSAINGVSGFNSGGTTIAYGANFYVAAGNNFNGDSGNTGYLQWSTDGSYWQNSTGPVLNSTQVRSKVSYANGLWHAVGSNIGGGSNTILYSVDGKAWNPSVSSNLFPGGWATGITYGQGIWVASGNGGASGSGFSLRWSADGSNWNAPTSVSWATSLVNDVLYTGSNFVAIIEGALNIAVSTDGKTWSSTNVRGAELNGAAQFLATGNGITLVASGPGAGAGQILKYSLDGGYVWQSNTDFTTGTLYRPFFDGITWWAGFNNGSGGEGIYYSFSGTSGWKNTTITNGFTNGGYPLAFTGSLTANTPGFQFNSTVAGLQNVLGVSTIQTNTLSTGILSVTNLVVPNFITQTVTTGLVSAETISTININATTVNGTMVTGDLFNGNTGQFSTIETTSISTGGITLGTFSVSSMSTNFISTDVMNAGTINVGVFISDSFKPTTVSTIAVQAGEGLFTNLVTDNISTITLNVSTLTGTTLLAEMISTTTMTAEDVYFNKININSISTGDLSLANATISSLSTFYMTSGEIYALTAFMDIMSANVAFVSSLNTETISTLDLNASTLTSVVIIASSLTADIISSASIYTDYMATKTGYFENVITSNVRIEASFLSSLSTNYISSMDIYTGYLKGTSANIDAIMSLDLNSQSVTTGRLTIPYLCTSKVFAETLAVVQGGISSLTASTINVGYISSLDIYSDHVYVANADIDIAQISTMTIYDTLNSPLISVENLNASKISTSMIYTCTLYGDLVSSLNMRSYLISTIELTSEYINARFGNFNLVSSFKTADISSIKVTASTLESTYAEFESVVSMMGIFETGDFEIINASQISTGEIALGTAFISTLSTTFISSVDIYSGTINASQANVDNLSTASLTLAVSYISCLSTTYISTVDLYGQGANFTIGNFDSFSTGSLVIGTASISSLSSIFISTLDLYVGQIYGDKASITNISSLSIYSQNISSMNLYSDFILGSTISSGVIHANFGTIDALQSLTISSLNIYTDIMDGYQANFEAVSTQHIYAHSISTYNLVVYGANTLTVQGAANMTNLNTTDITVTNLKATNSDLKNASITKAFMQSSMANYISSGQVNTSTLSFVDIRSKSTFTLYVSSGNLRYTGVPFALDSNASVTSITAVKDMLIGINTPPYIPRTSIMNSTDGYNWCNSVNGTFPEYGNGIAYSERQNKWVAVGYGKSPLNSILHSYDGLNWISSIKGGFTTIQNYSFGNGVAYDSTINTWVATGLHNFATSTLQNSTDGIHWTGATSGGFNGGLGVFPEGMKVISDNKGRFFAVGKHQTPRFTIQKSTNGRVWTPVSSGGFNDNDTSPNEGHGIATNGSNIVAVGKHYDPAYTIQYSTDGNNFVSSLSGGFGESPNSGGASVTYSYSKKLWIATGYGIDSENNPDARSSIQISTDGRNWRPASNGGFAEGAYGVSYSSTLNTWITLGEGVPSATNSIQVSTDAFNWVSAKVGFGFSYDWNGIAAFDAQWSDKKNLWLAVGTADKDLNIINYYSYITPSNITISGVNATFISTNSIVAYGPDSLTVQGYSELTAVGISESLQLGPTALASIPYLESSNIVLSTTTFNSYDDGSAHDLYFSSGRLFIDDYYIIPSTLTVDYLHVLNDAYIANLYVDQISSANILISTLSLVDIETEYSYDLYVSDSILYFDGAPVLDSNVTLCNLYVIDTISTFNLFTEQISAANILISTVSFVDVETEFNYDLYVSDSILYFDGAPVLASNTTLCNLNALDQVSTYSLYVYGGESVTEVPSYFYDTVAAFSSITSFTYINDVEFYETVITGTDVTTSLAYIDEISTAITTTSTINFVDIRSSKEYSLYVSSAILSFDGAPVLASNTVLCNLKALDQVSTKSLFVYSGQSRFDGPSVFNSTLTARSFSHFISTMTVNATAIFNAHAYANSTVYANAVSTNNLVVYGTSTIVQGKSYFYDNMTLTSTFFGNAISTNTVVVYGSSLVNAYLMSTPILFVSSINGKPYPIGIDSNIALCNILAVQGISTNNMLVYGSTFLNGLSFVNNIMTVTSTLNATSVISTNNLVVYGPSTIIQGKSYFNDILTANSTLNATSVISTNNLVVYGPSTIVQGKSYFNDILTANSTLYANALSTNNLVVYGTSTIVEGKSYFNDIITANSTVNAYSVSTGLVVAYLISTASLTTTLLSTSLMNAGITSTGTLTANTISTASLNVSSIDTSFLTANLISTVSLTTNIMNANTISSVSLNANSISTGILTANEISTNFISTSLLLANLISTASLTTNFLSASLVNANTVSTYFLFANMISTTILTTNFVSASLVTASTISLQDISTNNQYTLYSSNATLYFNGSTIGSGGSGSVSSNLALSNLTTSSLFTNYLSSKTLMVDNISVGTLTVFGPSTLNVQGSANFSKNITLSNYTAAGSNQIIIVVGGYGGNGSQDVRKSTDGITWNTVTLPPGTVDGTNIPKGLATNGSNWVISIQDNTTSNAIVFSTDTVSWTPSQSGILDSIIYKVAYGNGKWLVTVDGGIKSSTDGLNWVGTSAFVGNIVEAAAYGNGLWVAVGVNATPGGMIQRSTDTINWRSSANGGSNMDNLYSIAWNGSYWLAGGYANDPLNVIKKSSDAINWTSSIINTDTGEVRSLAWNGSVWVACGDYIQRSTDGLRWSQQTTQEVGTSCVTWTGTKFITSGSLIQSSTDGITWTSNAIFNNEGGPGPKDIATGTTATSAVSTVTTLTSSNIVINGCNIAVSSNLALSNLTTSTLFTNYLSSKTLMVDNISVGTITVFGPSTLRVQGSANFSKNITLSNYTAAGSNQVIIAIGTTDEEVQANCFQVSTDGITWNPIKPPLETSEYPTGIATNGSNWVITIFAANTVAGSILFSTDYTNWSPAITGGFDGYPIYPFKVAYGNGLWVAVGTSSVPTNGIQRSTDGRNWSSSTFSGSGAAIAYGNGLWVAGVSGTGSNRIQRSTDAINWQPSANGAPNGNVLAIAWNGSYWLAGGEFTAKIQKSTDAINWTNSSSNTFISPIVPGDFAWSDSLSLWVGSARDTDGANKQVNIQSSTDGLNWLPSVGSQDGGGNIYVTWTGTKFITSGDRIQSSTDGRNWTSNAPAASGYTEGSREIITGTTATSAVSSVTTLTSSNIVINGKDIAVSSNLALSNLTTSTLTTTSLTTSSLFTSYIGASNNDSLTMLGNTIDFGYAQDAPSVTFYGGVTIQPAATFTVARLSGVNSIVAREEEDFSITAAPECGIVLTTAGINLSVTNEGNLTLKPKSGTTTLGDGLIISNEGSSLSFPTNDDGAVGAIINLSSINGIAYVPGGGGGSVSSNLALSNLTTSTLFTNYISSRTLVVSSINGFEFTGSGGGGSVSSNLALSNLTTSTLFTRYVSATSMFVSSINGFQFTGSGGGSVSSNLALSNLTTSSLFTNYVSSRTIIVDNISVGTLTVFGPSTLRVQGSAFFSGQTVMSNLVVSTVNGAPYSGGGGGSISSNIAVDTITANNYITLSSFVVSGMTSLLKSTDGSNWASIEGSPFSFLAGPSHYSISKNLWVAAGIGLTSSQTLAYSTDANSWSYSKSGGFSTAFPFDKDGNLAYSGTYVTYISSTNLWLAGGVGEGVSSIRHSTDGSNWRANASGGFVSLARSIQYANGIYVAAGDGSNALQSLQYSTDGSNWRSSITGGFTGEGSEYSANGLTYSSTLGAFFATGEDIFGSTIQKSTDGSNWRSPIDNTNLLQHITWGNSILVALQIDNNQMKNNTITSTDGSNWYNPTDATQFGNIVVNGISYSSTLNQWVAAATASLGSNSVMYSTDASHWSPSVNGFGVFAPNIHNGNSAYYNEVGKFWLASGAATGVYISSINETLVTSSNIRLNTRINSDLVNTILTSSNLTTSTIITSNMNTRHISLADVSPGYTTSLYVAGGNSIQTSTDGFNWTPVTFNLNGNSVTNMATNGSNWVGTASFPPASNSPSLFYSLEGNTYLQSQTGGFTGGGNGVAFNALDAVNEAKWVSVGSVGSNNLATSNTILSSSDGSNWTPAQSGGFYNGGNGVTFLGSDAFSYYGRLFIAFGNDSIGPLQESSDGYNWFPIPNAPAEFTNAYAGVKRPGNDSMVIVGEGAGGILTMSVQTPNPVGANGHFSVGGYGVAFGVVYDPNAGSNEIWVAVGKDANRSNLIQISTDTTNWISAVLQPMASTDQVSTDPGEPGHQFGTIVNDIISLPWGGFIAVGDRLGPAADTIEYSEDGILWLSAQSGGFTVAGYGLSLGPAPLLGSSDTIIAVGESVGGTSQIQKSTDGRNWVPVSAIVPSVSYPLTGVAWNQNIGGPSRFVVTGRSPAPQSPNKLQSIIHSTDSISWRTALTGGFDQGGYGIIWNSNTSKWYATGATSLPSSNLQSSTDGLNWDRHTSNSVFNNFWSAIAYNGTTWVGVGLDSNLVRRTIAYSTDSLNWTSNIAFNTAGNNIMWDGSNWWASGNDTGPGADLSGVRTSSDGSNWAKVVGAGITSPIISQIAHAKNTPMWVAIGSNAVWYSYNGINWNQNILNAIHYGVVWGNSNWFIVGNRASTDLDTIKYSSDGVTYNNITSGGFTIAGYTIAYSAVTVSGTNIQTLITPSNLLVNSLPAVPYSGYGSVSSATTTVSLPYTYPVPPSVVVAHYNTGPYSPTIVYLSSITTSNFSVDAKVYNNSSWSVPPTNVQFTWIATASNQTPFPSLETSEESAEGGGASSGEIAYG